jgi:microsomal prostaglandin-E synthase 2
MGKLLSNAWRKMAAVGGVLGIVTAVGGYQVYQRRLAENRSITAVDFNQLQDQKALQQAFGSVLHKDLSKRPSIQLYRYTTCPFCGMAKAFLDYHGIVHECVEVEPMFKGEIADCKYKKVPQLQFNGPSGPKLVDSEIIVETLAPFVGAQKQLSDEDIKRWRGWARNQLVRFLVLNINSSLVEAWRGYDYIDNFDTIPFRNKLFLKLMGAPVMYGVAQFKTMPALIASGDMKKGEDVRARLHEEIKSFTSTALIDPKTKKQRPFHGGQRPDLADLDVYGVLQSVRGHKVYADLTSSTEIGAWLAAMDELVIKKAK